MVDNTVIAEKTRFIERNLRKLQALAKLSREDFFSEFYYVESVKHLLQVSVEAMLDIAQHIIARERFRAPTNYADAFMVLFEEGILPVGQRETLVRMARFRNRVVHLYQEIDDDELYGILQERLGDFTEFIRVIVKVMK
jgi:uncharacterized protein YutE (UPF0331/DUF86 family)